MNRMVLLLIAMVCSHCIVDENYEQLNADSFQERIENEASPTIIDVRTPAEYGQGHLEGALNINWNDKEFENQVTVLNRNEPVFVYCLSGGRSSRASMKLLAMDFKNVIELKGGILEWRKNNFTEKKVSVSNNLGLSISDFNDLLNSEKLVVVSYNAKWCAPCKVMRPILDEISIEMADTIKLLRIDYDENPTLMKTLGIHGLPTIQIYSSHELLESRQGFKNKKQLQETIRKLVEN